MTVSSTQTLYVNIHLKVKATDPDFKKLRLEEAEFTWLHATINSVIGLGFKATNQRPELLVPRVVSTSSSPLVPPRIGILQWKEKLHNEAVFNGNPLFSLIPSRIILLSWIIFSNTLFPCSGGGNIGNKMAPSPSMLLLPVWMTHTCWQQRASASSLPAELEVDFNLPLPSLSSGRLSA